MKQIVPVAFDPFAEDPNETQPAEHTSSKADGSSQATKIKLEVTLSNEVMAMLKRIMTSLDSMAKPKRIRLVRDANGVANEAIPEYDKPERLN